MKVIAGLRIATMIMLMTCSADAEIQSKCTSEAIVSLSLSVRTNETGHVNINGHLDLPQGNETWQVDVEHGTPTCSTRKFQSKFITFKLTGTSTIRNPPLGYTLFPEMGYFRASKVALTWQAAKEACERDGAHLATAESQQEAEFLATQFSFDVPDSRYTQFSWYGASDIAQEGKFVAVTGLLLNKTGFATFQPGKPNGGERENCIMLRKSEFLIDDAPCDWLLAYTCKVPL